MVEISNVQRVTGDLDTLFMVPSINVTKISSTLCCREAIQQDTAHVIS